MKIPVNLAYIGCGQSVGFLTMDKKEIKLKENLIAARKVLKSKLAALKQGEIIQEESFLPITKRLQTIASKLDNTRINPIIKQEFKTEFQDASTPTTSRKQFPDVPISTPRIKSKTSRLKRPPKFLETSTISEYDGEEKEDETNEAPEDDGDNEDDAFTREAEESLLEIQKYSESPELAQWLGTLPALPRQYIHDMIRDTSSKFDHRYGVRFNIDADGYKFKIGNSEFSLDSDNNNIYISTGDGRKLEYKGTPGLYELLFKKEPVGYNPQDERNYLDIVERTSAHRRDYDSKQQVLGNKYHKYQKIISKLSIKPLVKPRQRSQSYPHYAKNKTGGGILKEVSNNKIDYVYWDDINELVDRLRLLVASQAAGHTGHVNEITSIIEELREAGVIE